MLRRATLALLLVVINSRAARVHAMRNGPDSSYFERATSRTFDETVGALLSAIDAAGMQLFARIDHAEAACNVGLRMPATVVLLFGNPRGGTPAMLAAPRAALQLPLRILVREDDAGRVFASCEDVADTLRDVGVPATLASPLAAAQHKVLAAVPA